MGPNSSVQFDLKTHATDFVPDALAADALRRLIHQQDEELKDLDDEIEQLTARLYALEDQRAEIAKSHRLHRAFLAPIRKLAPEILGEVFIQCLLASRDDWPAYDVRLLLLRVCQRWKRIAIGTPGLWTFLRLEFAPQISVQMCLDNAGCLPIHVHLVDHSYVGSAEIPLLLDNFHRVQEIEGYCSPLMQGILHRGLVLQTPLLRMVHLAGDRFWRHNIELENIIQPPPIESLELIDCADLLSIFCRKPGKLQHLKVEEESHVDMYTPALLDILPFSSSLRSLDLLLPSEMTVISEDVWRSTLPHLHSLSILGQLNHICQLLAALDVPSLDCLTLCTGLLRADATLADGILWNPIQSLLQGNPPPLRYLTLEHISLGHGFVDFVSRLSHLEYLRLDMCHMTSEHLGAFILSHIPYHNMVCPRLATLSFNEVTLPGDVLIQVVQSRVPLHGIPGENRCLRTVKAWCGGLIDHYVALEDIREACSGQLTLDLGPWSCCV